MDRSTFHSWINFPNSANRKCTVCGCMLRKTSHNKGINILTYERNGVVSEVFIPCVKFNPLEEEV